MAKRTDEQIVEYMKYYISNGDRQWALESLARVEKKSEEEIIAICEKHGLTFKSVKGPKSALSEEKREEIRAALREGLTLSQVAERCHVGASTAGRIRVEMKANGEKLPENTGGRKATAKCKAREAENPEKRQPEAYPGQIYDDYPEPVVEAADPVVENDVKIFIPGEQTKTFDAAANSSIDPKNAVNENCEKIREQAQEIDSERKIESEAKNEVLRKEIEKQRENTLKIWNALSEPPVPGNPIPFTHSCGDIPCKKQCSGLWFAIRDSLSEYLLGTFGAGTELTGESVEPDTERLIIRFKTADGKAMRCTLRAEEKHGK